MDVRLQAEEDIKCVIGSPIKIIKLLAEEGESYIYIVEQDNQKKALKWYKPNGIDKDSNAFYANLKQKCLNEVSDKNVFLWPEDITEWKDNTFGYVMPLFPQGYYEIGDFLLTKVRFSSLKTVIDAAMNIVTAYYNLHKNGYVCQYLGEGNFFFNPINGAVLITGCDNVMAVGTTHTNTVGVPGFTAPEIILGSREKDPSKRKIPDSYSDRFSMSIIIFMLFCLTRPLEGKRVLAPRTGKLMEEVYGSDVHFIMENINHPLYGPDPESQKNVFLFWNAFPKYVKDYFLNAFSQKAISNPGARLTELSWLQMLVRFRSDIIRCRCGSEVLTEDGKPTICSRCKSKINVPFRITFTGSNYSIPGVPKSKIYRCQLGPCNENDALSLVGRVFANKTNPDLLGIGNFTDKCWKAKIQSGKIKKVMPGEIVPVNNVIKILIEDSEIIIEKH